MAFADFYTGVAGIGKAYEDGLQRNALAALGDQLQGGDLTGAAKTAFGAGDPTTGLKLLALGQAQAQQKQTSQEVGALAALYGGSGGFGVAGPQGAPVDGSAAAAPRSGAVPSFLDVGSGPQGDYLTGLFRRESNFNTNAQAPTSSARGLGQFTKGTWNQVAAQHPDLNLTPVGGGQDGRIDPQQMVRATQAHTADNEGLLRQSGLPVTDATKYSLHIFGTGGGRRFVAGTMRNPDAPAASYVNADQVAANRSVFFNRDGSAKSAGQVMGDFGRSFGGGGASPSRQASASPGLPPGLSSLNPDRVPQAQPRPAQQPVAFANDEGQTQALERRMGMMPQQTASLDPRADMPAPTAQDAGFVIPPGPGGGAPQAVPSSDPNSRTSTAGPLPVPTLGGGAPAGRVMTMPGAPSAPPTSPTAPTEAGVISPDARAQVSAQAPQHLAQAGVPAGAAQAVSAAPPGSQQRIAILMRVAALPGLSDAGASVVKTLLDNEIQQTRLPDDVKQYMVARNQGFTGSLIDFKNELRKPLTPFTASPGQAVFAPGERTPFYVAPRADDTKLTNVPAGTTVFDPVTRQPVFTAPATDRGEDEASKISAAVEARRKAAPSLGLEENSPAWRSYVATGKVGADRDMSVTEKKAIQDADNAAISAQSSIGLLEQAKKLSEQAYGGPFAKQRGDLMSAFGQERGQATQELDNLVTTNALTNLKSIFGGNPTEGERKILLDVAGSSSLPHPLRVKVYQRAIDAATLRMQQNADRANQIREGTYYRPGGGAAAAAGTRQGVDGGNRSGPAALPPPSPSNRPGAVSAADRFGQLIGSGMSKAQAYQQLHSEGY